MIIYDYNYKRKCELNFAYDITENLKFGDISNMTFKVPFNQFDIYGNKVLVNGLPIENYNLDHVVNENIIEHNDKFYIIKNVTTIRDNNKYLLVTAQEKLVELAYKTVDIIDITEPLHDAISIETILLNVLSQRNEIYKSKTVTGTGTSVTLDDDASAVDDYYNGYYIFVTYGTGSGQYRRITDYVGATKVATISALTVAFDNTTEIVITDSKYVYGDIDSSLTSEKEFDYMDMSKLEIIKDIANKYNAYVTFSTSYNSTYNEFENKINIVKANNYDGVEFRYKKNLQEVDKTIDTSGNVFTRIYPYGKNNLDISDETTASRTDSTVTYDYFTHGNTYLENYQYFLEKGYSIAECRKKFRNDFVFNDSEISTSEALFDKAEELLEKYSLPKVTYKIKAIDLSVLTGYSYENFNIGDTIKVIDNELDIDISATVIEKKINSENPQNAQIILSNFIDNIGDIITQLRKTNNGYTDINKVYGKSTTYIIADKATSKNWRYADFIVDENNTLPDIIEKICAGFIVAGGRVILLDGTYLIDKMIEIDNVSNIVIEGQGQSTIIKFNDAVDKSLLFAMMRFNFNENATLKNLILDGNIDNTTKINRGIRIASGNYNVIDGVTVKNINGMGMELVDIDDYKLSNCVIENIYTDTTTGYDGIGIKILSSDRATFKNITIDNCDVFGIDESTSNNDILYDNITITNCDNVGFSLEGNNGKVSNSTIDACNMGLQIKGDDIKIINTTIKNSVKQGVYIYSSNNSILNNNSILSNGDYGVWCVGGSNLLIVNNFIKNSGDEGIFILSSENDKINNNFLYENDVYGNSQSIYITNSTSCEIQSNKIRSASCTRGIKITGCTDTLVINNDLIDGYVTTAIYESVSTGTITTSQNRG